MKIGDRFRVIRQTFGGISYPWVPYLVGQTGVIIKVHEVIDDCCGYNCYYSTKMDEPFLVKRPNEGSGFGYDPPNGEKQEANEWVFGDEEIEQIAAG